MHHRLLAASAFLAFAPSALAQQPALPKAPEGFKVEIVLQAPDIEAPTALCVAPNGDVYYAEDPMDMSGPPTKNLDRIWMLKGGDPKKKVLIAEQMWAVMGMEIVRDKLYVVHAPYVTVFTLDAEGKAKERQDLFTDLGPKVAGLPGFNDHIPSGIRMGMDGWLYVSIGDKGIPKMTRKEKDGGSVHVAEGRERRTKEGNHISLEGGGVIRFRPDGSGLEVFASGTRNHLDVPMDEHDRIFVRDNTDDGDGWNTRFMYLPPGAFMGYPWAFKKHPKETLPMIHDFGGGSPCGGFVYCDDGLPEKYRGRVFHCEWGKGKVFAVKVAPDGAGFKLVDEITFLDPTATSYKDFRPYTLRPTADGKGFYVTDWGYSGWLAKVKAGRLLKVTYTGDDVKPAPRGKDDDKIDDLVKSLDHPAHSERLRAQRELIARGKEAGQSVAKLLDDGKLSGRASGHAIWVLRETRIPRWTALLTLQASGKDHEVKVEAARALGSFIPGEPGAEKQAEETCAGVLCHLLRTSESAPVRVHAASALKRVFDPRQIPSMVVQLRDEKDPSVRFALTQSLKANQPWAELGKPDIVKLIEEMPSLAAAIIPVLTEEFNIEALSLLIKLAECKDVDIRKKAIDALARVHHDRKPYAGGWWGTRPEQQKPPSRVVEWEGTPKVRDALLAALNDKDADVRKAAVAGLLDMNDLATLDPLVKQYKKETEVAAKTHLVRAIAGLQAPKAAEFLSQLLLDAKADEALRIETIAGLEKSKEVTASASIAKVAVAAEPVALQVRALEALGTMKAKESRAACETGLKSEQATVRVAAAGTLGKLGDAAAAPLLLPLLEDKDAKAQTAAIQALGLLKSKAALPGLLKLAAIEATQFEAITALAKMPDVQALPAYLTGLGSKNADLRKAAREAILAIREEAVPTLEKLVKGNEVRSDLLPELRSIYSTHSPILEWQLIGPFPKDDKAHPPEKEIDFAATYKGVDKDVKWRKVTGDAKNHGKVDLLKLLTPNTDVVAYAYAEIESAGAREVHLLAGSDDTITLWLNGVRVHSYQNNRGWKHDSDKVKASLRKGKNTLLVACGNAGGGWEFSVAIPGENEKYAFLKGGGKKFNLDDYRAFVRQNAGDAARGQKLFVDVKGLACVKCHAVAGQGGLVGPDLAGIALKYKREDLMTSVLEPSKVIAQGYETIIIATTSGKVMTGVFKGETGDAIDFMDAEGKRHSIPKKNIDERGFSPVSLMPNGLNEGMTLQDFADVIAYLEARREEKVPEKK